MTEGKHTDLNRLMKFITHGGKTLEALYEELNS